jgi:cellulose synthase/poly-beta-1,6-N-acetylglucosamine synthase-like glycosyltransferase
MGIAEEEPIVSVIVPVATAGAFTRECLRRVLRSMECCGGASELVLVLNGLRDADRRELDEVLGHPSVTCIERAGRIGSAPARCLGVHRARGRLLLLTDADCLVPDDWVAQMVKAAGAHDVACGQVQAANACANSYVRIEQEVDRVRNSMTTRQGTRRFPTVANMIARRDLLTLIVDDRDNTAEDIQLSVEYIRRGILIATVDDAAVRTVYPSSLAQCLRRRAKHARGVAFAQKLWSRREWRGVGMRGPLALGMAAFVRIWRMRLSRFEQLMCLLLRLCFAAMWAYYLVARPRAPHPPQVGATAERSG